MERRETTDATVIVTPEPDFLQGGVTERRVREESERYANILQAFSQRMERERASIDREFIRRIMAISHDPFVQLDTPEHQQSVPPEQAK